MRTHIARHRRALRLAVAAALAVPMVVTVGLLDANAATPAFAMDVDPEGSMVVVTVYSARPGLQSGVLDELIGALPADEVDDKGRPLPGSEPVLVALHRIDDRDSEGSSHWGGYKNCGSNIAYAHGTFKGNGTVQGPGGSVGTYTFNDTLWHVREKNGSYSGNWAVWGQYDVSVPNTWAGCRSYG